jgi:polysaccharide biosynthesis protein PslH
MLRVLAVIPDLPHPPFIGFHVRVLSLLEAVSAGNDLAVVGSAPPGADLSTVRSLCRRLEHTANAQNTALLTNRVHPRVLLSRARRTLLPLPTIRGSYSPDIAKLVRRLLDEYDPQVLHLEGDFSFQYRAPHLPAVASTHDVLSKTAVEARDAHPWRFALGGVQGRSYRRFERTVLSSMSAVVAINDDDRDTYRALGIDAETVPFAVPLPAAAGPPPPSSVCRLLFVGTFEHAPNREAALLIERELVPQLDRLELEWNITLAGRRASAQTMRPHPRVSYAADLPSLDPLYRDSDIVIAPLPYGGGTKTKTLEAMAWKRPVIGTPAAFTGLRGIPDTHYVVAHTFADMALAIAGLAGDRERRLTMGEAAGAYLRRHHSQEAVDETLGCIYARIGARGVR